MKRKRGVKKRRKQEIRKEEIAEDWCFVCKDGGSLRVCDYGQCLKSYHPECVEKDDSFLDSESNWTCGWHYCFNCKNPSKYHCFCCPNAVCQSCADSVEFACIRDTKGFCHNCVKLALLGEADETVDSDGKLLDFRNRETFECLFFEYWLIVKKEDNLTSEDLQSADTLLKNWNKRITLDSLLTDSSESNTMSDPTYFDDDKKEGKFTEEKKRSKGVQSGSKRKTAKPKRKFIDWGSEALIEFLTSIDEQTSEKLSQHEVTSIVSRYINENSLFNLEKKRKVVCDAKLQALIQKKSFLKNKLYDLLEPHLAENNQEEDDEFWLNFSDDDDDDLLVSKKKKALSTPKEDKVIEKVLEGPISLFAAIVEENIKLAFLLKTVVKQMLDNHSPEAFDSRVIGCFVKIKSDPMDFLQKNYRQLVLITGVQRILQDDEVKVILQATTGKVVIDLDLEKIFDGYFTKEELDDLKKRVEDGLIPRPTIVDLELKAKTLHLEITNYAIDREIRHLTNNIDFCNQKGWREKMFELLGKRELLQSPEERKRMLETVPQVIPAPAEIDIEPPTLNKQAGETLGSKEENVSMPVNGENKESILESEPQNSMLVGASEPKPVIAGEKIGTEIFYDSDDEIHNHWMW